MSNLHKAITIATTILFLALSNNVFAINKCVSPSGQTTYTDKPCPTGSTSNTVKVKTENHKSETKDKTSGNKSNLSYSTEQTKSESQQGKSEGWKKRWPTLQAYKEYYCANESGKTRTPAEIMAQVDAVSRGDIPSGAVCCRNNKPVSCK